MLPSSAAVRDRNNDVSERPWWIQPLMRGYAENWEVTTLVRVFHKHEGRWVLVRFALLWLAAWLAYDAVAWSFQAVTISVFAFYTFCDAIAVTTAHAFVWVKPPRSVFRFVILNLAVFMTLPLWFAILLAPVRDSFSPNLVYKSAYEVAFTAVTASGVLKPAELLPEARAARDNTWCGDGLRSVLHRSDPRYGRQPRVWRSQHGPRYFGCEP